MPATEVIRLRVTADEKERLRARCEANGTTMSDEVRSALGLGPTRATTSERFRAILDQARAAQESSGLPRLSEQEVIDFVDAARAERAAEAIGVAHA